MKQVIFLLLFLIPITFVSAQEVDSIIDIRDGQIYNIVKIGQQWWMQENLNIGFLIDSTLAVTDNNIIEKYYYQKSDSLGNIYGGLYQWYEMMDYSPSDNGNPGITQGVCPVGWHLPTDSEWIELTDLFGGLSVAGGKLKEFGTIHWTSPNAGATNESGFTALPGGMSYSTSGSLEMGSSAYFWSSTESSSLNAWNGKLYYDYSDIALFSHESKISRLSVRCLKDSNHFSFLTVSDKNLNTVSKLDFTTNLLTNTIILINSGTRTGINISSISNSNTAFNLNKSSSVLSPGDSTHLSITFNPPSTGFYTDTLFIENDDPFRPLIKIPIEGKYQTEVPCGVITENTTWTKDISPYHIGCNVAIAQGVTLTIEPGVKVLIDSMKKITVDGVLVAKGIKGDTVVFTNTDENKFDQIYFRSTGVGDFSHFKIENAISGLYLECDSFNLSNGLIQDCMGGVFINRSNIIIDSCTIRNNSEFGFKITPDYRYNPTVYIINSNFQNNNLGIVLSQGTHLIANNTISCNNIGIVIKELVNSTKTTIKNNLIRKNNSTGIINTANSWQNVTIENNSIDNNGDHGIESSNATIRNNYITGNTINGIISKETSIIESNIISGNLSDGINQNGNSTISYNDIFNNGDDGIETSDLPTINSNNIFGNSGYNIHAIKQSFETINAENNYWGTIDNSEISNSIYDYYDDGTTVMIDFDPFLFDEIENSYIDIALNDTTCYGAIIPSLTAFGDSLNWYSEPDFTGLLYSGNTFETGKSAPGIYTYYVTQTLNEGTVLKDTATLFISSNPEISTIEKSDESGCTSADGSITINASNEYPLIYSIDGGISYFENAGSFTSLDNGNYPVAVKNEMGCITAGSTIQIISEGDIPSVPLVSNDTIYCPGEQMANITAQTSSGGTISWYDDPGLKNLKGTGETYNPTGISSTTTFYATETLGDCESSSSEVKIEIRNTSPFEDEKICMVTVDLNTGYNMIIWEKTADVGTQYFNVYREGTLIGTTEFHELSILKDTTGDPETRPYLYFLTTVDSCGNESELSPYHKPLFLQYVSSQDGVNLRWSNYAIEGELVTFNSYAIYRGSDSLSLSPFAENIPTAIDVYTDNDATALTKKYYYRIAGVLTNPCYPSGTKKAGTGPYFHSLSNMDDNRLRDTGDTTDTYIYPLTSQTLLIYPNPINNKATIQFSNPEGKKYHMQIIDGTGRVVFQKGNITEDRIEFQRGDLPNGLYLVELRGPKVFRGRLILD